MEFRSWPDFCFLGLIMWTEKTRARDSANVVVAQLSSMPIQTSQVWVPTSEKYVFLYKFNFIREKRLTCQ